MGRMKSGYDRRDEVLGSRLREAMEDLSPKGEPDFAAIELSAGPRDAMPASGKAGRRRASRTLLLLPAAAALALVVGFSWNRLAGARAAADADDLAADGLPAVAFPEASQGDPLGTEVSLLARESVGGDRSLPSAASGDPDSFHEEIAVFVAGLWDGPGPLAAASRDDTAKGSY